MPPTLDLDLEAIAEGEPEGYRVAAFTLGDESDPNAPRIRYGVWPPHLRVDPHKHPVDYCEIIVKGSQRVGNKWYHAGHARVVRAGTGYGPLQAGPDGCEFIVIFAGANFALTWLPTTHDHSRPIRLATEEEQGSAEGPA